MSSWLERANLADQVAYDAHFGQLDKSGVAYIEHPMRVAENFNRDSIEYVVAALHDVVEDTPVSLYEIGILFGTDVEAAVDAISRREGELYRDYMDRVMTNQVAVIVKYYDLMDNLSPNRRDGMPDSLVPRYEASLERVVEWLDRNGEWT